LISWSWNLLFRYQTGLAADSAERSGGVMNTLLPFLKRAENGSERIPSHGPLARRQRQILFGWYANLIFKSGSILINDHEQVDYFDR
jgi:hypothetical protein